MVFIAGFSLGVLVTIGFALLSMASDEDDKIDNTPDFS
jgi:hypothetical protein